MRGNGIFNPSSHIFVLIILASSLPSLMLCSLTSRMKRSTVMTMSSKSTNANSALMCQYSMRCLLERLSSARKLGPILYIFSKVEVPFVQKLLLEFGIQNVDVRARIWRHVYRADTNYFDVLNANFFWRI